MQFKFTCTLLAAGAAIFGGVAAEGEPFEKFKERASHRNHGHRLQKAQLDKRSYPTSNSSFRYLTPDTQSKLGWTNL
jgi:hypothetical protein